MNGNNTDFYNPTEEEIREIEWQIAYEYYLEQQWMEEQGIDWEKNMTWEIPIVNICEKKYSEKEGDDLPF